MKFLRFDKWSSGLLVENAQGTHVLNLAAAINRGALGDKTNRSLFDASLGTPDGSWIPLIEAWDELRPLLATLLARAEGGEVDEFLVSLNAVILRPPLADRHCRTFAIGGNFTQHLVAAAGQSGATARPANDFAAERDQGHPPWGFIVLPETIVATEVTVTPPPHIVKFDYEAEVAVVLRDGGRGIARNDVRIWGYTAWNDLSIRDPRMGIGPMMDRSFFTWGLEKNFDGSNPCGPWLVVEDDMDVNALHCQMRVNGEVRQDFSTAEMIWSFGETVEHISSYISLKPGDMILSGTGAGCAIERGREGAHWLKAGDVLEVEVEGVGTLRNRVGAWGASG